jgi:hypothetical protein
VKRQVAAALAILGVVAGVGWKLASHSETSAGLQEVSLQQRSEHARAGSSKALAGIRIRLSGSEVTTTTHQVPQISLAE